MIRGVLTGLGLLWMLTGSAQRLSVKADFRAQLTALNIDLLTPVETDYRDVPVLKVYKEFQPYNFAMKSRREKLEIRFLVAAIDTTDQRATLPPSAHFMRTLTHLAANSDDPVAVFSPGDADVHGFFNADYAKEALFTPKGIWTDRSRCRMLHLYKEGVANVFIFFLFDGEPEALDRRYYALRFGGDDLIID